MSEQNFSFFSLSPSHEKLIDGYLLPGEQIETVIYPSNGYNIYDLVLNCFVLVFFSIILFQAIKTHTEFEPGSFLPIIIILFFIYWLPQSISNLSKFYVFTSQRLLIISGFRRLRITPYEFQFIKNTDVNFKALTMGGFNSHMGTITLTFKNSQRKVKCENIRNPNAFADRIFDHIQGSSQQ